METFSSPKISVTQDPPDADNAEPYYIALISSRFDKNGKNLMHEAEESSLQPHADGVITNRGLD